MPVVDSQTTDVGTEEGGGATETDNDHSKSTAQPKLTTAALKSAGKSARSQAAPTPTNNINQTVPSTTNGKLLPVSPSAVTAADAQMLSHSASVSSPSEEDHSWVGSQPSSKLPSRQPSGGAFSAPSGKRKDSTSGGGGGIFRKRRGSELSTKSRPEAPGPGEEYPSYPSRPPSTAGSVGEGRFNLKDLLGAPKLSRKGSASSKKSVSSKKSESGGKAGSTAGESNFSKKYGVCGKLAIGKGATSVVRLAHKWDRTEEKLYAVKVQSPTSPAYPPVSPALATHTFVL
jgi:protein-serine/threonine kinase